MKNFSYDKAREVVGFVPDALQVKNSNAQQLITTVSHHLLQPESFSAKDYASKDLASILLYLRKSHVFYLDKKLPEIDQNIHHLHALYPNEQLFNILKAFFQDYQELLAQHIEEEESTIFNYIDYLVRYDQRPSEQELNMFLLGCTSLEKFIQTHSDTEKDLTVMRQLLGSSEQYKQLHPISLLLHQMATLENHLHIHARIEDEVLIPKALELEAKLG